MARKTAPLLPATEELLRQFGERLRLARLRRQLSARQVAERAGMTPMTLRSLERGGSGVTIGAYLAVMQVLGIEKELNHVAQADPVGRSLQDAQLTNPASQRAIESLVAAAKRFEAEQRGLAPSATELPDRGVLPERPETASSQKAAHVSRRSARSSPVSRPTNWPSSRKLANLLEGTAKRR